MDVPENPIGRIVVGEHDRDTGTDQVRSAELGRMVVRVVIDPVESFVFVHPDQCCHSGTEGGAMHGGALPVELGPFERQRLAVGVHIVRLIDGPWIGFIVGFLAAKLALKCPSKIESISSWRSRLVKLP